jgi:SNF2 family DNA or RNA helicase
MHVDLGYWTIKEPVIFNFRSNDAKTKERMKELRLNASVLKTQSPLIFIDHSGTSQLPHPDFLAMFKVMLTTTKRFVNEWKNGSFEAELKQQDGTISPYAVYRASGPDSSACPLLKVHWTRMVVDEGHSMGRGKLNNGILFASWISASRRWSMTGTPTPQTTSRSGMSNLLALMGYLKHEFFTPRLDGDRMWQLLSRSWNNGSLASFFQVRSLLAILMMRHTKLDIAELPPPKFHRVWLDMSRDEQTTFNTLVCAVQSNLLLTSMEGKTSGRQDSLLHKRQTRHARLAFENLRLACSGGLRVVPQINGKAWDETVELLDMHGLGKAKRKLVLDYMTRAVTEQRSHCMICGIEVSTLLVLPCGDLVCTECMTGSTKSCSVCDSPFDVDDFQRLQPGIVYEWYDYYKQEEKQKAESLSELEEITSPTRMANSGGGQADLAGQIALQPATATGKTKKRGDGHECEYSIAAANGKCKLCHEEHDDCVMIAEGSSCSVCHRISEICPEEESKFHHIVAQLDRLQTQTRRQSKIFSPAAASFAGEQISLTEDRPLKVIIFSQFRKVLNLIGHRLIRRYGAGAVAEFWGSYRRQELAKFKMSNDCFCMLLSKDGSEGLDLSFVTHIFFLEEIWDKSLQDQAVARAWRMGAKGHVEVETLLAKHTVESLMAEADQKLANTTDGKELESVTDMMRSKMVHILKNLRLMGSRTRNHQITKRKADDNESTSRKKTRVRFAD